MPGFAGPTSIQFASTAVGSSATQAFDVTSAGTGPLRLGDFELEGDRADFTADRHCRHVLLPPGRSCHITVQFTPTAEGSRNATLIIHQNLPGPASRVQLAGIGLTGPARRFALTVGVEAGADLRVTTQPPGIDCPGVCEATFPAGTTVTLQATTKSGTIVWEGDCAGAVDRCTLKLDSDRHVMARVVPPPDLVPGTPGRAKNGDLIVTVANQGTGAAKPSTTNVLFGPYGTVSIATPALASGASTEVETAIPTGCFDPDCDFTIVVDAADQLRESDEGNNSLSDTFIG